MNDKEVAEALKEVDNLLKHKPWDTKKIVELLKSVEWYVIAEYPLYSVLRFEFALTLLKLALHKEDIIK